MPAPIVAGAAVAGGRIVAGSVRTTGKVAYRANRAIAKNREERREETADERGTPRRLRRREMALRKKKSIAKKATDAVLRALHMTRVAIVHANLALPLLALYVVQVAGYIIFAFVDQLLEYIVVRAVDTIVVDLDWIWMVGWGMGTMAGLASVGLLIVGYSTALINWLKLWSIVALILTITLYFAPYLLIVPWVLLWMTVVFWSK